MPKPILVIKIPYFDRLTPVELDNLERVTKKKTEDEYHVLVFMTPGQEDPMKVELFKTTRLKDLDIPNLRKYLRTKIKEYEARQAD